MKTTVAKRSPQVRKTLQVVLGGMAAVALVGAALSLRSPDATSGPLMAERPVVLPDGAALYVQKYEVSVAEWNACHDAGACTLALRVAANRSADEMPATGLAYPDVREYLTWINAQTRQTYRLPTLAEWEFMAAEVLPHTEDPFFTDPSLSWASAYLLEPQTKRTLRPSGSFETTSQGIVDLDGSVWEWTAECYRGVSGEVVADDRCPAYYVGGEHTAAIPYLVGDPARGGCAVGAPPAHLGMRLVMDADRQL